MRPKNICIIGMGYVGLTLGVVLAERGFNVYGIEAKKEIIDALNNGNSHVTEPEIEDLLKRNVGKKLFFLESIPRDVKINAFVIAVGTPINHEDKTPNMIFINHAVSEVAEIMEDGQLIVLRSTIPIGMTRKVVLPLLQKTGKKFYLAFCPERTAEGRALQELQHLPQIIGGLDDESVDKAMDLFRRVTHMTVEVESLEAAEMIKLIDNSYRDVMFSYSNEIAMIAKGFNLNSFELIEAANFGYPRNNIKIPGFVGGACLEKDPYILNYCAQQNGYEAGLIMHGRKLNESLHAHTVQCVNRHLSDAKIKNPKIFISGFAFKGNPETNDLRGSPTLNVLGGLRDAGYKNIFGHDFIVSDAKLKDMGVTLVSLEDGFKSADVVLLMNNHKGYKTMPAMELVLTMKKGGFLFDGWQMLPYRSLKELAYIKYESIGYR